MQTKDEIICALRQENSHLKYRIEKLRRQRDLAREHVVKRIQEFLSSESHAERRK
jgi:hypothetical protein